MPKRICNVLLIIAVLLGVTGCGTKTVYNNAERLVKWGVSDYVDLSEAQADVLDTQLADLKSWHRATQLPLYSQYFYELSDSFVDGVSREELEQLFDRLPIWAEAIRERGLPIVVQLLGSLSDDQLAVLPERLEKDNRETAEEDEGLPLEKIQANWADEFEDGLERFTGRLSAEQRAYILSRSRAYQPERLLEAEHRRLWQADVLVLLEERVDRDEFEAGLRHLVDIADSYDSPEYTRIRRENRELRFETAAAVLSSLTEKQLERLVDYVRDLAEDFAELVGTG